MTNLEATNAGKAVGEALVKGASEAAISGSQDQNPWADIAVDSLKHAEQMQKSGQPKSGDGSHRALETAAENLGKAASSGDSLAESSLVANGKYSEGHASINKEPYFKHFKEKVTDEQRKQAKERLEKDLSDLIPEKDRQSLKSLQAAIIDGDLDKLQSTLKELSGNPEQLKKLVNALNKDLGKNNMMGIDLNMDGSGNVLLYERNGSTALSINPKTGESTIRPMETQMDGSVVIKPGEIINRTSADVLKNIGDEATRNLTQPYFGSILKGVDSLKSEGGSIKPYYGSQMEDFHKGKNKLFNDQKPNYDRIPQELNQLRQK